MKLHVFVLHYEKDAVTHACVSSLWEQVTQLEGAALFVIDNGSPTPYVPSGEPVIRLRKNAFLIDAFNKAIERKPADAYLCVTNDTLAGEGMVRRLYDALQNPAAGVVAPGTNDMGAGVLCVGDAPRPELETLSVRDVDNTCWGFRQDVIEQVGTPDCTGHTHRACWASNADFCYRVRRMGYEVQAVRGAYIRHAHHGGQDEEARAAGWAWLRSKWGAEAKHIWNG